MQNVQKLRKRAYRKSRSNRKEDANLTSRSKTQQFIKRNFPGVKTPEVQKVSRQLLKYNSLTYSMSTLYRNIKNRKERKLLKDIVANKIVKKYRIMREIHFEALGLKTKIRKFIQFWSFFESGHGKGAADGIGETLKQIADRIVSCGTDISDVHQFIHLYTSPQIYSYTT